MQTDKQQRNPNQFWCEGGVTVSRIHRSKGNEADMVYVVGLDSVAKDESNLQLRNQLFVALTRAKGWVKLSGADLSGADLTGANLEGVDLSDVILTGATMPDESVQE